MTDRNRIQFIGLMYLLLFAGCMLISGCATDSYAAKGAAEGGTTGAVAGAVGGMVTALIFGGDVAEAGARGAVYGGTTGAVVGGMSGSKADKAVADQQKAEREAELAVLKEKIGSDAYNGIVALAECKHELAVANASEAIKSKNSDYALAGIWVETLTEGDRKQDARARALFPEIIARDRKIKSEAAAEEKMREALQELESIRVEYGKPAVCSNE
jgi:hypothetical protein